MSKKIALGFGITAFAVAALGLLAHAQEVPEQEGTSSPAHIIKVMPPRGMMSGPENQAQVLQVEPSGKVLLRGTLASVSSGTITVNSWGGAWTINLGSSTRVLPDINIFKTGDFVGVQGKVSTSASWTIDAEIVRDRTPGIMSPFGNGSSTFEHSRMLPPFGVTTTMNGTNSLRMPFFIPPFTGNTSATASTSPIMMRQGLQDRLSQLMQQLLKLQQPGMTLGIQSSTTAQ